MLFRSSYSFGPMPWVPGDLEEWKSMCPGQDYGAKKLVFQPKPPREQKRQVTSQVTGTLESIVQKTLRGDELPEVFAHDGGGVVVQCSGPASDPDTVLALKIGGQGFAPGTVAGVVRESVIMETVHARCAELAASSGGSATAPDWLPQLWEGQVLGDWLSSSAAELGELVPAHSKCHLFVQHGLLPLAQTNRSSLRPCTAAAGHGQVTCARRLRSGSNSVGHSKAETPLYQPFRSSVLGLAAHWQKGGQHVQFMKPEKGGLLLGAWTSQERRAICIQLMRAVGHLHMCGLIHRDLKESNFLVVKEAPGARPCRIDPSRQARENVVCLQQKRWTRDRSRALIFFLAAQEMTLLLAMLATTPLMVAKDLTV